MSLKVFYGVLVDCCVCGVNRRLGTADAFFRDEGIRVDARKTQATE